MNQDDIWEEEEYSESEDEEYYIDKHSDKRKNDWRYALHNYKLLRAKWGENS